MKILVVDDSRAMRMIVKRGLTQAGYGAYELLTADCAESARALIVEAQPDLMLVDINMPGTSGVELVESLQRDDSEILFGMVTAERSEETLNKAVMVGAQFVLHKPFTALEIQLALEPVIRTLQIIAKLKAENTQLKELVSRLSPEKSENGDKSTEDVGLRVGG